MKKIYNKPEIEINFIEVEDIITASGLKYVNSSQTSFEEAVNYCDFF